jgi:hypothetical protein
MRMNQIGAWPFRKGTADASDTDDPAMGPLTDPPRRGARSRQSPGGLNHDAVTTHLDLGALRTPRTT